MQGKIIINGAVWCRNITGIERTAIELTQILDELVSPGQVEIVFPKNARNIPEFKNISKIILNKEATFFPKWTQFTFQKYVLLHKGISLDFDNTAPYFCPGIEFLHDIYGKINPSDFSSRRDRLIQLYSNIMGKRIARHAKEIITVSEYSKDTIIKFFKAKNSKITVIYNGLSTNYKNLKPDFSIFDKLTQLKQKQYYFTLGSLSVRKNLKWIALHAEKYPQETFVVSGKPISGLVPDELKKLNDLPNVIIAGYLSDAQVKALMTDCRAFIFPSYFEGFGLPPLEALGCGTSIIVSNTTCLPEIYGKTAHYINPDDVDVNLEELLREPVDSPKELLEKFTIENTAKSLYNVIKKYIQVSD